MAITKTRTVQRIEVYPGDPERVMVVYNIVMDDPDDNELPVTTSKVVDLVKSVTTVDDSDPENPVETTVDTDISGEDELVQTVCNAVWAE